MVDIFSSFDDHYIADKGFSIHLWVINVIILRVVFYRNTWDSRSNIRCLKELCYDFVYFLKESNSKSWVVRGFFMYICGLFILFCFRSSSSICPYCYRVCSHFSFSSYFALCVWGSLVLSRLCWQPFKFIQQAIPLNCPSLLVPLLFILEIATSLIRPITLTIRLCMNTIIGQIILIMVSSLSYCNLSKFFWLNRPSKFIHDVLFYECNRDLDKGCFRSYDILASEVSIVMVFTGLIFSTLFTLLEVAISFLQVCIFCMLCFLYEKDHTS